jgi:hypothetical protein
VVIMKSAAISVPYAAVEYFAAWTFCSANTQHHFTGPSHRLNCVWAGVLRNQPAFCLDTDLTLYAFH